MTTIPSSIVNLDVQVTTLLAVQYTGQGAGTQFDGVHPTARSEQIDEEKVDRVCPEMAPVLAQDTPPGLQGAGPTDAPVFLLFALQETNQFRSEASAWVVRGRHSRSPSKTAPQFAPTLRPNSECRDLMRAPPPH